MKHLFADDHSNVGLAVAFNLVMASLSGFSKDPDNVKRVVDASTSVLHFLIMLSQLAVAVVTVYFILRKARAVKLPKSDDK